MKGSITFFQYSNLVSSLQKEKKKRKYSRSQHTIYSVYKLNFELESELDFQMYMYEAQIQMPFLCSVSRFDWKKAKVNYYAWLHYQKVKKITDEMLIYSEKDVRI